jgi:hypothetical protein
MDASTQPDGPVKAALFVDFDNIYIGLRNFHPKAAEKFATDPKRWLAWLEHDTLGREREAAPGLQRRILLRLCYLNPQTFREYRPDFTRTAFKVVDCPPLTIQNKTSTDIHMVMDILDAMRHDTRFDEFIILSGDSDFTPVLLRLRSHDRRTVILTAGPAATAYKAASDHIIGVDAFIENGLGIQSERVARAAPKAPVVRVASANGDVLNAMAQMVYEKVSVQGDLVATKLLPIYRKFPEFKGSNNWLGFYSFKDLTEELARRRPEMAVVDGDSTWSISLKLAQSPQVPAVKSQPAAAPPVESAEAITPPVNAAEPPTATTPDLRAQIIAHVGQLVANSAEKVHMAAAAWNALQTFGDVVQQTQWAGAGSFKELLTTADGRGFDIGTDGDGTGYLYDPSRHTPPVADIFAEKWKEYSEKLSAFAHRVNSVTGTPLLTPDGYALVFGALEDELQDNQYFLTATARAVRDRCIERGNPVQRRAVNFILQGITYAGHQFEENPLSDTAQTFAEVFKEYVLTLCKNAQLVPSDDEVELLKDWIRV